MGRIAEALSARSSRVRHPSFPVGQAPRGPMNLLARADTAVLETGSRIGKALAARVEPKTPSPTVNPPGVYPRVQMGRQPSWLAQLPATVAETIPTEAAKFVTPSALLMQAAAGGALRGLAGTRLGQFPVETLLPPGRIRDAIRRMGAPQIFAPITRPKAPVSRGPVVEAEFTEGPGVPRALPSPETVGQRPPTGETITHAESVRQFREGMGLSEAPISTQPALPAPTSLPRPAAPPEGVIAPPGLPQAQGGGVRQGTPPGTSLVPVVQARTRAITLLTKELREQTVLLHQRSRDLFKTIRELGGIDPNKGGGIREEIMTTFPTSLLRGGGRAIDEIVSDLTQAGFPVEDSNALLTLVASSKNLRPPLLAQLRQEAARITDTEAGQRLMDVVSQPRFAMQAANRLVKDVAKQVNQEVLRGQQQVRGILSEAQRKAMTPAQLARFARVQRIEPGATTLGPRGGVREAPLSPADVRRVEATTAQVVPRTGQPTGTPPIIPTSRALIPANVPRPVRDLNQFQSTPLSGLDPSRAAQLIDNATNGPTQRQVLTPLRTQELAFRQEQQRTFGQLRQVSGNLKEGSPESRQVFLYLEGRLPFDRLSPNAKQTAQWMAQQFDDLLGRVNQARESVGKRPILRREGYITHIKSPSLWDAMREAFTNAPDEATKNLQTAFFEQLAARGPGFQFGLPRRGGPFQDDAVRAFKAYLPAALRVIHLSEPSRLATVYVNRSLAGTPNAHRYFSQLVRQVATGEQGPIAKVSPRAVVQASNWLKGRFGKGTILGNLSSVLQQPFTLPATIAQNGPEASTAAAAWIARGDGTAFAMQWSPTLQARVMEMDVDFTRLASKWDAAMGAMFAAADRAMVAHAFNSGYLAAVKKGATFPAAIEAGEQSALRTQSSFLTTDMAPVFRDSIAAGFLQFQNTINGVFNFLKFDVPRAQNPQWAAGAFVGTFVAMAAIYEALGLPHPDQISDFIPGLSTTRSGGPVGVKLAVALSNLGSSDERKRHEAARALSTSLPAIVFGAGSNQIRKSFAGLQAVAAGGKFDARGRMQFPVTGLPEQARAVAFGPYQTKAGRAYIQRGFKPVPLTDAQGRIKRRLDARRRGLP